ncbi:hypothetical protein FHX79_112107 [Streptomyces cavourensis]|uniref:hypothetical protein n=1 Tax=Streptomyces TaxID=1883 RepID=UPI001150B98B|nr:MULTISPECIES: hypothetical protein [Streptomyces]NUV39995.1 hypothetical protein [Streptomyces sp. CAI-24]TQO30285.1 hypothetical protein FHX79_112107 [Streptomyces cavourensis]GGU66175.1 hypothetical protein GCM10010498_24480 [Streptomyces cavourensis]
MKKRWILVPAAAAVAAVIGFSGPAQAATATVSGTVKSTTTYYSTARTISVGGSNIYLKINARSVDMKVFWYKCGDRSVRGQSVHFAAHDTGRKRLGTNFAAGTTFCLGAAADIGEGSRTWSGKLDWNVSS